MMRAAANVPADTAAGAESAAEESAAAESMAEEETGSTAEAQETNASGVTSQETSSDAASSDSVTPSGSGAAQNTSKQETQDNTPAAEETSGSATQQDQPAENSAQPETAVTAVTVTAEESPEIDTSVSEAYNSAKKTMNDAQTAYAAAVQANETRKSLEVQKDQLDAALRQLNQITSSGASPDLSEAMKAAAAAQSDVATISTEAKILMNLEDSESAGLKSIFDTLDTAESQIGQDLSANQSTIQASVRAIDQLPVLADSVSQLSKGASVLDAGIAKLQNEGVQPLTQGAGALKSGTSQIYSGTQQLTAGAGQLDSGASQLKTGLDQLAQGAGNLDSGAGTLKTGADKLDSGTADLYDGAVQLDDGASDLYDGTVQLLDGTGSLDDGAQELLDGLNKYNKEGIQKLTELFGDNVQDVLDRLQAVTEAGDDYNSFSGALPVQSGDDENGGNAVKFIYRTDSIKAD